MNGESMEIIHDGWLKKSPPEKRIWRAKWRRRWFVLRQSGQIPGQYFLEYFTDQTCKKRKGIIDLDQCEQVDCGVTVEESWHQKNTFEHVFDIRTPKRLYYLVADQETEMNTWVEYICSVCGLKMHVEGNELDQAALELPNQVVSSEPSPFQEIANILEANATRESVKEDTQSLASVSTCGPSGPYIPISECISGPSPLIGERLRDLRVYHDDQDDVFPDQVPPPPPKGKDSFQVIQADFYDYPRQMHPPSMDDMASDTLAHANRQLYGMSTDEVADLSTMPPPPRVNWDTYPRSVDSENIYANNRRASDSQQVHALNSSATGKFKRLSLTEGNVEDSCASQTNLVSSAKQCSSSSSSSVSSSTCRTPSQKPPPRPPKPKPRHLIETLHLNSQNGNNVSGNQNANNSNNYDNIANCDVSSLYDVPPSAQGVFLSKNLPANAFAYLKDNRVEDISDFSPPCGKLGQYSADEMYDFPKNTHDGQLEATPPAPTGESIWQRRHAYSNAPTLLIGDGDGNNNNGEEYLIMDPHQRRIGNDIYTDMSGEGRSPTSLYSNVPSPIHRNDFMFATDAPPAVDRGLKPGRKAENVSPKTQVNPQLERTPANVIATSTHRRNAPVVNRELKPKRMPDGIETIPALLQSGQAISSSATLPSSYINANKNKRSFRKPRLAPGRATASFSRLTSSNGMLHPNNRTKDRSSSDDDQSSSCTSSRRNSSNDDHVANKQTSQAKSPSPGAINSSKATNKQSGAFGSSQSTEPELHYLDLDLENDAKAQSPKSPSPKSPEKLTSTVYNTVDFVRTKAFNDTRQHVEATYRKS